MIETTNYELEKPELADSVGAFPASLSTTLDIIETALTTPTATIKGRKTAGSGVMEDLTAADARAILNVADGANAYVHPNHSGDVTSVNDGAQTIVAKAVTLAKMADMATASLVGRTTAAVGVPEVLSKTAAKTLLDVDDLEVDNSANKINIAQNTKQTSDLAKSVNSIAGGGSGSVASSSTTPVSSLANTAAGVFSQLQLSGNTKTALQDDAWATSLGGWTSADDSIEADKYRLTKVSNTYGFRNITSRIDITKYYLFTTYGTANSDTDGSHFEVNNNAGFTKTSTLLTKAQSARIGVIVQPSEMTGGTLFYIISNHVGSGYTEFYQFFIQEISAAEYAEGLTVLMDRYNYRTSGTKSTAPMEITVIGKNLFDNSPYDAHYGPGTCINANGSVTMAGASGWFGYFIKVKKNTNYYLSVGSIVSGALAVYDTTVTTILSNNIGTFNSGEFDIICIVFFDSAGLGNFIDIQLGLGTTATAYAPYQSPTRFYTPILHSVPAIADTFDGVTGILTQNTAYDADISGADYTNLDKTTYANIDTIRISALTLAKAGTTAITGYVRYYNSTGLELSEIAVADIDNISSVGKFVYYNDKNVYVIVTADTYADIAAARIGLGTTSLRYQLATPTVTYYSPKTIPCPANATISQDGIIADYGFYATGLTIADSTYPIITLAEVVKVDQSTGAETQIAISTCTVAGGGLSFTSTALADGDLVWYRFYRSPFYTIGTIGYTRTFGLWEAWTPTLTWTTGTPASITTVARYVKNGGTCYLNIMITSADGNAATQLSISLPATPIDNNSLVAFASQQLVNTTWTNPMAYLDDDSGGITFRAFAAATDGNTVTIIVSGQYEI